VPARPKLSHARKSNPGLFLPVAEWQEAEPSMQGIDYVIHSRPCGALTAALA